MTYIDYMDMPFDELFHIVFTNSGEVKSCGREACSALIERLNAIYPGSFDDLEHGFLKLPDAFEVAKQLL